MITGKMFNDYFERNGEGRPVKDDDIYMLDVESDTFIDRDDWIKKHGPETLIDFEVYGDDGTGIDFL